jgi:hypothetical protein
MATKGLPVILAVDCKWYPFALMAYYLRLRNNETLLPDALPSPERKK